MDEFEIRMKSAEIAMNYSARVTAAFLESGMTNLTELAPMAYVKEIEEYIRIGKIPKPIPVTKSEIR